MLESMIRHVASRVPQVEYQWLGGLKTIAGRLTFYRGVLTFLMLIPVAYDSSIVKQLFPTLWVFALALFAALGLAAVAEYGVVYPSQLRFQKDQAARNDRDPIYKEVRELRSEVADLHDKLEGRDEP